MPEYLYTQLAIDEKDAEIAELKAIQRKAVEWVDHQIGGTDLDFISIKLAKMFNYLSE